MRKLVTVVLVLGLLVGATLLALAMPADAAPACPSGWGSLPRTSAALSPAPVDQVRAGRHACFDRLAFIVAAALVDYNNS